MNTGKLLQRVLKDVCAEKFSTRIRYDRSKWRLVEDDSRWNGYIAVTDSKSLYFVDTVNMFLDWNNINNGIVINRHNIVEFIDKYEKQLLEVDINGRCIHQLSFKRIEKCSRYGKSFNAAVFDYMDNEMAFNMKYLDVFDNIDSIEIVALIDQYSPVAIVENDVIRAIIMPVLL